MTIDEKIAAAEAALHRLMTGSLREEVEYQGQRVRFTKSSMGDLSAYLDQLRAEKAGVPARGAIGFIF